MAISAHEEAIRKAEEHNAIWKPRIERAAIAARELERVMVFFEAIRLCASKMEIGVNLMPEPTPALDRVVEMSSLIGSLREAYKEFALDELPWPEKARQLPEPRKSPSPSRPTFWCPGPSLPLPCAPSPPPLLSCPRSACLVACRG